MGACARNMQSDPAEIKPAQCCIKLVFSFDLYYDARKHKIKKYEPSILSLRLCILLHSVFTYLLRISKLNETFSQRKLTATEIFLCVRRNKCINAFVIKASFKGTELNYVDLNRIFFFPFLQEYFLSSYLQEKRQA